METNPTFRVALVGSPNVGKSMLFNRLTGTYVVVSNYPGTSVEIAKGKMTVGPHTFEVIDTPGMYSLLPMSEEERVGRDLLRNQVCDLVLHVVDAKNLERMLPLTLQLLEAGYPLMLVLNVMDEAEKLGMAFDLEWLENELHIPVVPMVSTSGKGLKRLKERIVCHVSKAVC